MFNLEKTIKKYLKKRIRITTALLVIFMITGNLGYAAEDEIYDEKKMFSIMAEIAVNNINYENEEEMILAAKKLYKKRYRISSHILVEKQSYKTKSDSKKLDTWNKYGNDNYEKNPLEKENEKLVFNKTENDKVIIPRGDITEQIIDSLNYGNIKVTPSMKEDIDVDGGNITSGTVDNIGIAGTGGTNGGNGNEGGRYENGENGGSGTNGGDIVGSSNINLNTNNMTVTGGTGGIGGRGGKGGDDWGHSGNAGKGGKGGNGGTGGNATGISTSVNVNGNFENIGTIFVKGGTGGSGANGGNGGDDKYTHTNGGTGGTGGIGGNAVGVSISSGSLKNTGSIIAIGGSGGSGGKGGLWGGNKGPQASSGSAGADGTGIGIQGNNNTILNTGVLAGSTSAVSGNNNNVTNIGIMGTTSGSNIISGTGNNFINAGIITTIDDTGKITNIVSSSSGSNVNINGITYTSLQMKNEIGNQTNKIINATNSNKFLTIGQDTNLINIIINGADYNNASVNINGGKTVIENGIVNSLNTNALKVNNNGELIFSNSTANGNINLSTGNNKLTFSNGSSLTGSIITGLGNNELVFDKSKYEIALDLSKGNDSLTIKNGSVLGEVKLGSGNNIVKIDNAEYNKNLNMSEGADELYLLNGGLYGGNVTFGNGNNKVFVDNTTMKGNIDLKDGNNEFNISTGIMEGSITAGSGADKLIASGSLIKNINLGNGENEIIITANSGIEGNIIAGDNKDILNLDSSIIKGNINLGNGENEVTITGINSGIDGSVTLGLENDKFTLKDGNIITGTVDMGTGENTGNITGSVGGDLISSGSKTVLELLTGKIFGNMNLSGLANINFKEESGIKGNVTSTGTENNIFNLDSSTIGGKLTVGSGDNTITLNNNSGILGGIEGGNGNNNLSLDGSIVKGEIKLGDGENKVIGKNSIISGDIFLGNSNNSISLENTAGLGNINLGNGNNNLVLSNGSIITKNLTFGNGNNKLELLNSQLQGNLTFGNGNNNIKVNNKGYIFGEIKLGSGNDILEFETSGNKNKYFNFNLTLGGENKNEKNELIIGSNSYLDGRITGSDGQDNIKIGGNNEEGQNIFNAVLDKIENILVQGNTQIMHTAKMLADKITIKGKGDTYLELGVDITKNTGIHTNHGLYGNTGIFETEDKDSHLIVDTSKINSSSIIGITGDLNLTNEQIKTDSLIHSIFKREDGNLQVIVDHSLPLENGNGLPVNGLDGGFIRYQELNQVYQSIYNAGKIGYLAQDVKLSDKSKEEAFRSLLSFLNQIYANNIYGYATKLSVDGLDLYKQAIITNTQSVGIDEWLIQGVSLYSYREKNNSTVGRNFYGWDRGKEKFDISTNTAGLLGMAEVGLTDKNTFGFDFAGSYQNSQISNSSELKAKSFYLGFHNRYENGNLKFISGTGVQLNKYEGIRVVKTDYSYSKNSANFNTVGFNAFADLEYKHKMKEGVYLIPHYSLNIGAISMSDVKEEHTKNSLGIEVDGRGTMFIQNEVGVKLQKEGRKEDLAYKLYTGISYINREGNNSYDLTGRIREGGSNFKILGERLENNNVKIEAGIDIEVDTGLSFNLGVTQEFDSKERRTHQYQIGLGYKF